MLFACTELLIMHVKRKSNENTKTSNWFCHVCGAVHYSYSNGNTCNNLASLHSNTS